jgi:hypothetical protein
MGTTITIDGVLVTDITPYRTKLANVRAKLATIYAGFDPAWPELLLAREAEIVGLANDAERLREIVERWDAADTRRANVLAAWELVKAFTGDGA